MQTSQLILKYLVEDDDYVKRVIPFLEEEYFTSAAEKTIFRHIHKYTNDFGAQPTKEALLIELGNDNTIPEDIFKDVDNVLDEISRPTKKPDIGWLIKTSEDFCKDRALHNALRHCVQIYEGKDKTYGKGSIPEILTNALAIGFDTSVGHDYYESWDGRYDYYIREEEKISTGYITLDKVLKGGWARKTLNLFLASTHGGKSANMINIAANQLQMGKNVLYISLEMSEEEIAKRIDAKLMGIPMEDFSPSLPKILFEDKIKKLKNKTMGKLIVKEYPTGFANVNHIRNLINELLLKKNFIPDVIYVDYLNLMSSVRVKPGAISNTNTYYSAIAVELRGLGIDLGLPIVSASQFNRGGHGNSDPDMNDTSEAYGINFTADWVGALVATDELKQLNRLMIKQLKSRYDDLNKYPVFFMGFDRQYMNIYDLKDPFEGVGNSNQPTANTSSTKTSFPPNKGFGAFKT